MEDKTSDLQFNHNKNDKYRSNFETANTMNSQKFLKTKREIIRKKKDNAKEKPKSEKKTKKDRIKNLCGNSNFEKNLDDLSKEINWFHYMIGNGIHAVKIASEKDDPIKFTIELNPFDGTRFLWKNGFYIGDMKKFMILKEMINNPVLEQMCTLIEKTNAENYVKKREEIINELKSEINTRTIAVNEIRKKLTDNKSEKKLKTAIKMMNKAKEDLDKKLEKYRKDDEHAK